MKPIPSNVALTTATAFQLLTVAACAPNPPLTLPGTAWLVEDIAGRGVIDRAQTTVSFDTSGRVSGSTGCNRFTGSATVEGKALTFGPLANTRRACPPALMDQEKQFLEAMASARGYSIDRNGLLHLDDATGKTLLRLGKRPPPPLPSGTQVYGCDTAEFVVSIGTGEVELALPGRTVVLPQVVAASGAKYQDGSIVFWDRGTEARIEVDGKVYPACVRRLGRAP
jgi:heat shock protein HslJ